MNELNEQTLKDIAKTLMNTNSSDMDKLNEIRCLMAYWMVQRAKQ